MIDNHGRTVRGEVNGNGGANTAGRTCHNCDFAFEHDYLFGVSYRKLQIAGVRRLAG